jgi:hypothetical protein
MSNIINLSWMRIMGKCLISLIPVGDMGEGCKILAISIILFGKPFTFEEEIEHIDVKRLHEFRKKS